jgi:hypothetical protein
MKHIKQWSIFEGFNTDDYYQEIDYEEWYDQRLNRLNISDNLNNRIKNLFDSRSDYQKQDSKGSVIYVDKKDKKDKKGTLCEIKISLNDDDWYYVYIYNEVREYYKCDQFDGLKKLLKDKGII